MKKLLLFVFITTLSITSSFAQESVLFASPSQLSPFITNKGIASKGQSFMLTGHNITNPVVVNAVSGFEISTQSDFSNATQYSITISQTGNFSINIFVRLSSTASLGQQNNGPIVYKTQGFSNFVHVTGEVKGNITILPVINNSISTYSTTDFPRGRNIITNCKTSVTDANTIDVFYPFIAYNSTSSFDLTVGNPDWLSTMELVDTLTYASIANTCQSNFGVGLSTRTYNFAGLTVGQKYMVRLELGSYNYLLGHARMEAVDNTFSLKSNSTVTDVSDSSIISNKTISNIYNLQGLEVSKDFRGLVIYKYYDGTTQKVVQE